MRTETKLRPTFLVLPFFFLEKTGETEDEERMEEEETEGVLDKGEDGSNGQPRDTDNASCTESLALASAT